MIQTEENDKKKELYNFWRSIPLIKRMSKEEFEAIRQETRNAIIELLRTGIKDEKSENNQRYALNAQEIQEYLNAKGIKTSLQNCYFHLNILINGGFIKEIAILKEGRFNKRYYGRTAKLFLDMGFANNIEDKIEEGKEIFLNLIKIANSKEPENAKEVVGLFLNEKWEFFVKIEDRLDKWFKDNAEALIDSNIDVKDTYELLLNLVLMGKDTPINNNLTSLLKI